MPRKARIDAPGALHHLIVRGIERRRIFQDDWDRNHFLGRLGSVLMETGTLCFAWALMNNHIHLLLRSGNVPLATVMRRLLTGYAVTYNQRHNRHGPLFQNRYKSILCQEDSYLLELVRYLHLNPVRVGVVRDIEALETYPYCGHAVVLGRQEQVWQDTDTVLGYFGQRKKEARKRYRIYVEEGTKEGQRPDLVGGGLIRSLGGWEKVKEIRKGGERFKGDERILGDSGFVEEVLKHSEEQMSRKTRLGAEGFDLGKLAERVAEVLGVNVKGIWLKGKYADAVECRSLLCYWAVRELGVRETELARKLGISQPAVSFSVRRGERMAIERGLQVLEK